MFYIKVLKITEKYVPVKKTKKQKQQRKLKDRVLIKCQHSYQLIRLPCDNMLIFVEPS